MKPLAFSNFCFSWLFLRSSFQGFTAGNRPHEVPTDLYLTKTLFLRYQLVVKFIHEMHISFSQWCFCHNHEPSELSIACIGIFTNAIECLKFILDYTTTSSRWCVPGVF
ncbi:hypothetical protein H0G86_001706 [Trichoderma simmonsii]|uniref:Secreted protein n=1 Tax=Trichoderma simmonsii TaxID=1491479 RepID=A0A8G0L243_9HYPO|nr:hypothetical protein H0G86_001706 [Trichoderma simmonsii]